MALRIGSCLCSAVQEHKQANGRPSNRWVGGVSVRKIETQTDTYIYVVRAHHISEHTRRKEAEIESLV